MSFTDFAGKGSASGSKADLVHGSERNILSRVIVCENLRVNLAMSFSNNPFCTGTIPCELGKLTALKVLSLFINKLTGETYACRNARVGTS